MNVTSTSHRIGAVCVLIAALVTGSATQAAASTRPADMSKAEYRALMLRSEALNEQYRLGDWKGVPAGMTAPQYRALMIRSEALNKRYGLGPSNAPSVARQAGSPSSGFAWGAFGIGAVAMLGLVLVAAGVIAASRAVRDAPRIRTS